MDFRPLTPANWADFEDLFGARGACGGCWCMLWRLPRAEFDRGKGDGNRAAMKRLVDAGVSPGVLAYDSRVVVGWCAVAPREELVALERSRTLKPVDAEPAVWSISCLFVRKRWRRKGVSVALIEAACRFAKERGARFVEGYPSVPGQKSADVFLWTGVPSAFERAGFLEVARPSAARRIVRFPIARSG